MEEEKEPQKRKSTAPCEEMVDDSNNFSQDQAPDKYYKKFDFFYKRTCFRLMAEFYKLLFQPF